MASAGGACIPEKDLGFGPMIRAKPSEHPSALIAWLKPLVI
jgi:hypothetical protein